MKNITVFIDFEENAKILVDHAAILADKFDSKVWLVHVAAPNPDFVGLEVGPQYIRDLVAEDLREEHRKIQKMAQELTDSGIDSVGLLIQGTTVASILDEIDKLDADLCLIGQHEHGFLHNVIFGNTALQVVRKAKIPVLVVPI